MYSNEFVENVFARHTYSSLRSMFAAMVYVAWCSFLVSQ